MTINDHELLANKFRTLQNNFIVPKLKCNGPSLTIIWTEQHVFFSPYNPPASASPETDG